VRAQSKPTAKNYVVINGRKVAADSGKTLDGPTRGAQTHPRNLDLRSEERKNRPIVKPLGKAQTLDGFRKTSGTSTTKPNNRKRHVRQTAAAVVHNRTITKTTQREEARRTQKAEPVTQKAPFSLKESLINQRRTPRAVAQTTKLTEARAQRAQLQRQHNQVTRFGRVKPERVTVPFMELHTYKVTPIEKNLGVIIAQHNINIEHLPLRSKKAESDITPERKLHLRALITARRTVSYAATAMTLIVIVGYVAYLNAPNMSIRVAAARAGVEAQMPGYTPSGFAREGSIEYQTGQVVIGFGSNSDDRTFDIAQRTSRWDSSSLQANYIANQANDYEVIEEGGLKIFIYEGSNASWVNNGIWYTVEGNSLLTPQQIASIATSF